MNDGSSPDRRFALMQLSDSFFPSGSFTLSHGLEALVQTQRIRSAEDFHCFLNSLLHYKVASSDLPALIHAYEASRRHDLAAVCYADQMLFAQTPIQTTRETQRKNGRALLMVAGSTWTDVQLETLQIYADADSSPCLHPIIFAVVGRAAGLTQTDTVFAFLHGLLTGLSGAAIRLGILGHLKAQQILKAMAQEAEIAAQTASLISLEDLWSCTPLIDIAQMSHQQLPQRLFAN